MALTAEKIERVLVAIDASLPAYDALEAAVEFATLSEAPLIALFVEDVNLVKLSELPFAKELDRSSGVMRPLNSGSVIRALEMDAQKLRKRLSEESKKRRISVSMKVVRGHYVATAVNMAGKRDIVFLEDSTRLYYRRTGTRPDLSGERKFGFGQKPVWVFYDGSADSRRCLALALSLSQGYGLDLLILMAEGCSEDELRGLLKELPSGQPGSYHVLPLSDHRGVAATAQHSGGTALVLPREGGPARASDSVLKTIRCPRILV
jgi:nucleotide-binding universal stress UspA family protein